jgi:DNA-binding transcriptional MerR regulator
MDLDSDDKVSGAARNPADAGEAGMSVPAKVSKPRATSRALNRQEAAGGSEVRHDARASGAPVVPVASLPAIPAKRYFTIGEVSDLCGVKPYVLRYWEQEFSQLRPMKRRGNRRYYQHHEVLLVRRIRELLYEQGFTISGARNQLGDAVQVARASESALAASAMGGAERAGGAATLLAQQPEAPLWHGPDLAVLSLQNPQAAAELREALVSIRDLLA